MDALERVASKQNEWAGLSTTDKLAIVHEMQAILKETPYETFLRAVGIPTLQMMGIPGDTDEGRFESRSQTIIFCLTAQKQLEALAHVLDPQKTPPMQTSTACNGQVCVKSFPLLSSDKYGPQGTHTGQVWLDPKATRAETVSPPTQGGVMVVLGAGNQNMLCYTDVLHGLFAQNCVVYLKHHPLREYLDGILRRLLQPLISRGYVDMGMDTQDSKKLVYHPQVTRVHLTGGKATHDAIVWGNQQPRVKPMLKAEMTSELGAVSPLVILPGQFKPKELRQQALLAAFWIHNNASCNCNAVKIIVVSQEWEQKDAFLQIVEDSLDNYHLPVAYYPGIEQRWQEFRKAYPDAKELGKKTPIDQQIQERGLKSALGANKALLLPILQIERNVDLNTAQGREAARQELAFTKEPFSPVYTVAIVKNTDDFVETATEFCNNYLFGSLSGGVVVPSSMKKEGDDCVAKMKYGSIGVNCWAGENYMLSFGAWGAFPGESLKAVESGIGRVNNWFGLANFQKSVLIAPLTSPSHMSLKSDLVKEARIVEAVTKLVLNPGVGPVCELVSALTGINMLVAGAVTAGAALTLTAYLLRKEA